MRDVQDAGARSLASRGRRQSENVNLQMKIKSLERLLSVQMSHLGEESMSRFEELSREVRKNVESAVGDNAGSEFCRAIQVALRARR